MFERAIERAVRIAATILLIVASGVPAFAAPPPGTCFAVRPAGSGDAPPADAVCEGVPTGYAKANLWLRVPSLGPDRDRGAALLVGSTRFDGLTAVFRFADGSGEVQSVRQGAFGRHWRLGNQIEFQPDDRTRPPSAIWLKVEGLQSWDLLRLRLVPAERVSRQFDLAAALIGAALALLAVTALYNVALAAAVRRRFFLWHALWATTMVIWGLIWSQGALFVVPQIAGRIASHLSTITACSAILFAALCATDALRAVLSRKVRYAVVGAAVGVVLFGTASVVPGVDLGPISVGLTILTLSVLLAVAAGLVAGWRRGDRSARDLAIAWTVPMMMLGTTQLVDFDTRLFGGGAQIAVLFASAFQALCLSALTTRRLGILRRERDAAIASETALAELAERDALTGLLNRRGFVRRCEKAFGARHEQPFGLLLIDVDRFKRINDRYGHEVGDAVLVRLGQRLHALEGTHDCLAGRLGGEEFLIGISGLPRPALAAFAEHVRATLACTEEGHGACHPRVTVSIGVAWGTGSGPFAALYGRADRALYEAKTDGRDRVMFWSEAPAA